MSRRGFILAAALLCLALVSGAADCLAMSSYSTVTGSLHVEGAYVPGDTEA